MKITMARLRKKKLKRTKRSNGNKFISIPNELVTEILARVSRSSITSLFNARAACKALKEASSDAYVYEHVSLKNVDKVGWRRESEAYKEAFLQRCIECGNVEALFREGLRQVFGIKDDKIVNLGFRYICKAAWMGHLGATYTCGIILVCFDGEKRRAGLELLSRQLTSSDLIKRCRKDVRSVLSQCWVLNHKVGGRDPNCIQPEHKCDVRSRGRSWDDDKFEVLQDYESCCDSCRWDHEAKLFFNMLKRGGFNC